MQYKRPNPPNPLCVQIYLDARFFVQNDHQEHQLPMQIEQGT